MNLFEIDIPIAKNIRLKNIGPYQLALLFNYSKCEDGIVISKECQDILIKRLDEKYSNKTDSFEKFVFRSVKSLILNMRLGITKMFTVRSCEEYIRVFDNDKYRKAFREALDNIGFYNTVNINLQKQNKKLLTYNIRVEQERRHRLGVAILNEYLITLRKYELAKRYKTKQQLQTLYIDIVHRITNQECSFSTARELPHSTETIRNLDGTFSRYTELAVAPFGTIQMLSRSSKAGDFLEMLYSATTGWSMLDTSMTKSDMLGSIKRYTKRSMIVVMYKLGIISSLDEFGKFTDLFKEDIRDIEKIEAFLGLK